MIGYIGDGTVVRVLACHQCGLGRNLRPRVEFIVGLRHCSVVFIWVLWFSSIALLFGTLIKQRKLMKIKKFIEKILP